MEVSSRDTTFKCTDGAEMLTSLSYPADASSTSKHPGIIVIHEAYGLNQQIRGVARRYAEQGFVAIAPHLFARNSDVMNERNIENAMKHLWTLTPEKRRDPNVMQELMKTMSDTDRKVF
jgi:carboxymethylenebutenolidase